MTPFFKRPSVVNTASAFVGITLPLVGAMYYMSQSDSELFDRFKPGSATEAVIDRLPQVAVIGQKDGPAGTTEVFIQVPGVLNMQSVYVLSDNKTVISGFVLPQMNAGGVPGGAIQMPTGAATVDPGASREGVNDLLALLRDGGEGAERVAEILAKESDQAQRAAAEVISRELPSPPAPAADEPRIVVDSVSARDIPVPAPASGAQSMDALPQSSPLTQSGTSASVPAPSHAAAQESPDIPAPRSSAVQQASASVVPPVGGDSSSGVKYTISDLLGAPAFSGKLRDMLMTDPEIQEIRDIEEPEDQQAAYLAYVKERPAVVMGDGPRHIYVLYDPNCPVCHEYYDQVKLKVNQGQLTAHWIPTVVFPDRRSSITASAQLLSLVEAGHPDKATEMLSYSMESDGYLQILDDNYSDEQHGHALEHIVRGAATMTMARPETPLIIYETESGALAMRTGIPTMGYEQEIRVQDQTEVSSR